jgi:hypothetical protein
MGRSVQLWILALLVLVGALARAEEKADSVADYKIFLASLPKDDPASITKAVDQYRTAIVPLDMDKRAKAFLEFLDFHDSVCRALDKVFSDRVANLEKSNGRSDSDAAQTVYKSEEAKELVCHGLELTYGDVSYLYVRGNPDHIPTEFSSYLPRSMRRYLDLRRVDMLERYGGDGAISVSFARLAERAAQWDQYITDFPNSLFREDALVFRAACLRLMLFGTPNTQLDARTEDRKDNIRIVYEDFMRDHPGTWAEGLVRKRYDYLQKEGFFNETRVKDDNQIPGRDPDDVMRLLKESANLDEYWFPGDASFRGVSRKGP